MRRASQYHDLKWIVQCKPGSQAFAETICAFNIDIVAVRYAQECNSTNPHNEYRVLERDGKGQFKAIRIFNGGF